MAVDLWQKTTAARRKQKAQMSLGIDLQGPDIPFHMHRTFEIAEAYREKREKSQQSLSRYSGWDDIPSLSRDAVFVTTSTIASRVSSRSQVTYSFAAMQAGLICIWLGLVVTWVVVVTGTSTNDQTKTTSGAIY